MTAVRTLAVSLPQKTARPHVLEYQRSAPAGCKRLAEVVTDQQVDLALGLFLYGKAKRLRAESFLADAARCRQRSRLPIRERSRQCSPTAPSTLTVL